MAKSNFIVSIIEAWGKTNLASQVLVVAVLLSISATIFLASRMLEKILAIMIVWSEFSGFEQIALIGLVICFLLIIAVPNFLTAKKYKRDSSDLLSRRKEQRKKHGAWDDD